MKPKFFILTILLIFTLLIIPTVLYVSRTDLPNNDDYISSDKENGKEHFEEYEMQRLHSSEIDLHTSDFKSEENLEQTTSSVVDTMVPKNIDKENQTSETSTSSTSTIGTSPSEKTDYIPNETSGTVHGNGVPDKGVDNIALIVKLINEIRFENGLGTLKLNTKLCEVAQLKAQDMAKNNYFAHNSPQYGSPFDMMKSFGIKYRTAGENLAMGYSSAQATVDGWMNSPGHRANILNGAFTQIGIGYVSSGNYYCQIFVG